MVGTQKLLILCLLAIGIATWPASAIEPQQPTPEACGNPSSVSPPAPAPQTVAELQINPKIFFQRLVNRYRQLYLYRDTVRVVQVTQRGGEEASRVETQINCEITGNELRVQTPASQVRSGLGLNLPIKAGQPLKDASQQYDLWLAPHMALKFSDQPLKNLRAGIEEGFTATEAAPVTIDNKSMVHVELKSGDGLSEDCEAQIDLFVNPDSMLIERIEGRQRLPDGAEYETTLHITPEQVEGEMAVDDAPIAPPPADPSTVDESPAANPANRPSRPGDVNRSLQFTLHVRGVRFSLTSTSRK